MRGCTDKGISEWREGKAWFVWDEAVSFELEVAQKKGAEYVRLLGKSGLAENNIKEILFF